MSAQKLWRDICAIFPGERVHEEGESLEVLNIAERLEDFAPQLAREINLTAASVIEAQPDCVILDVPGFLYM